MSYKPEGYPSLSPYLCVRDSAALIAFLEKVFGGQVTRRYDRPDGTLMHAEVRIDDSIVMIGEPSGEWQANANMIHLYVPDAREAYRKALEAGASSQQEPGQKEGDSDLRGGFLTPCGTSWWVSTQQS